MTSRAGVAKAGYLALAVDLASRAGGTAAATNVAGALTQGPVEERTADLDAGLDVPRGAARVQRQARRRRVLLRRGHDVVVRGRPTQGAGRGPVLRADAAAPSVMAATNAAILAQYGETDARVNGGIPDLEQAMAGKTLETVIYPGAGHALQQRHRRRLQRPRRRVEAWGATLGWFSEHLA